MTDKEFKRLSRAQLIDIIYQLQLQIDELTEKNQGLEKALEDKRIRIKNAGNIAHAALEINDCFHNAQNAAEQYLNEIKEMHAETQKTLDDARTDAASIISAAKESSYEYDRIIKDILKKYEPNGSNQE